MSSLWAIGRMSYCAAFDYFLSCSLGPMHSVMEIEREVAARELVVGVILGRRGEVLKKSKLARLCENT